MHPILFKIGPITFYALWMSVIAGLMIGTALFLKRAKYNRLNLTFLVDHSLSLVVATILTSRLVFFLTNWSYFGQIELGQIIKKILYFWQPGFSFWGGVLGFVLIFWWHARREKEDPLEWLSAVVVPLFVGMMIGNLGQLLDGQAYGNETSLPWGITFETTNVKYTVPIHPTQIYSILILGALVGTRKKIMSAVKWLQEDHHWALFAVSAYSLSRFIMEFLRGDDTYLVGNIRIGFIVSAILFVLSTGLLYKGLRKNP